VSAGVRCIIAKKQLCRRRRHFIIRKANETRAIQIQREALCDGKYEDQREHDEVASTATASFLRQLFLRQMFRIRRHRQAQLL